MNASQRRELRRNIRTARTFFRFSWLFATFDAAPQQRIQFKPLKLAIVLKKRSSIVNYSLNRKDRARVHDLVEHVGTYLLTIPMNEGLRAIRAFKSKNPAIAAAANIAFLIRNSFSHGTFSPRWDINAARQGKKFVVPAIMSLNTTRLDGKRVKWSDFGGPNALYKLSGYVLRQL